MITVLYELIGAGLALGAAGGGIAGVLVARAKDRMIASIGATIPEVLSRAEAPFHGGPFRSLPARDPGAAPRVRRRSALLRHDYDLMIGRTFFR